MAWLGATKRMPSAEATSPLPHTWAIGRAFCAATMRALAAAMVSGRMKFWLTQDSRLRLRAGWSVRTIGSKPMLQACAIRLPHRLVVKSSTRAWRSLTWVKASAKSERAATSSMTSGKSIFGMRAAMADCRAIRLGGRSILSSGLSTSSSRPLRHSMRAVGFPGRLLATWRHAWSSLAARSPTSASASGDRSRERQTVRRAAFQASPLSRPCLGSAKRTPAGTNTSRRFSPALNASRAAKT